MSKKNKNPYKSGNYQKGFEFIQKLQIVKRSQLVEHLKSLTNKKGEKLSDTAANATATVLLSPRAASKHGDCRGNYSAEGHIYFMEPLKKTKGEEKRFRLRFRNPVLESRTRPDLVVKGKKNKPEHKAEHDVKPEVQQAVNEPDKVEETATATEVAG